MMLEVEERGAPVNLNTFLVNSALSPREKQNPSFRTVTYRHRSASRARQDHGVDGNVGLESFTVRYLNLTEVYESPEGTLPQWNVEYDFASAYGATERGKPNSLLPPDVQRVVHDIFEVDILSFRLSFCCCCLAALFLSVKRLSDTNARTRPPIRSTLPTGLPCLTM